MGWISDCNTLPFRKDFFIKKTFLLTKLMMKSCPRVARWQRCPDRCNGGWREGEGEGREGEGKGKRHEKMKRKKRGGGGAGCVLLDCFSFA